MSYWLIKLLLLLGLVVVVIVMVRPVKSANHLALRRLLVLLAVLFAAFAIIFPELMNRLAWSIGVVSGVNLLVYLLVIIMFGQIVSAYRRDASNERKLTELSRAIAMQSAPEVPASLANNNDDQRVSDNNLGGKDQLTEIDGKAPKAAVQATSVVANTSGALEFTASAPEQTK